MFFAPSGSIALGSAALCFASLTGLPNRSRLTSKFIALAEKDTRRRPTDKREVTACIAAPPVRMDIKIPYRNLYKGIVINFLLG